MRRNDGVRVEQRDAFTKMIKEMALNRPEIKTERELAGLCGCSAATLSNYKNGYREPDASFVNRFALIFCGASISGRGNKAILSLPKEKLYLAEGVKAKLIEASLYKAREEDTSGLVPRLRSGIPLKISSPAYAPIAGPEGTFFEDLSRRFFDLCGIKVEKSERKSLLLGKGGSDVLLAVFEAPDRILRGLRYWRVPIRIGLGAVCMAQYREEANKIALVLTDPKNRGVLRIQPIVVEGELGMVHCMARLGFNANEVIKVAAGNVDMLTRELKERSRGAVTIPVVCTDELKVMKILALLANDAEKQEGIAVFPLNSKQAIQSDGVRRELPQYYCSMAVERGDNDFERFLQEALTQFLTTDIETTATSLFETAKRLFDEIRSVAKYFDQTVERSEEDQETRDWETALRWVFFSLSLDRWSIKAYGVSDLPWKAILYRTREKFQRYLSEREQRPIVTRIVEQHCMRKDTILNRGVRRVCEDVFDIEPVPVPINDAISFVDPMRDGLVIEAVVRGVCGRLEGRPAEVVVGIYDDREAKDYLASQATYIKFKQFLRLFRQNYEDRGKSEEVRTIEQKVLKSVGTKKSPYGGNTGRVLFAIHMTEGQQSLVGSACLTGLDRSCCELWYLWVEPRFRGSKVGTELIQTAISETRYWKAPRKIQAQINLDIFPTAGTVFHEVGFRESTTASPIMQRIPFEMDLPEKRREARMSWSLVGAERKKQANRPTKK